MKKGKGQKQQNTLYRPYGIDMKYEYKTYKYVGKDYGDRKSASRGWVGNLKRWLRKKKNKKQGRYAICNTYTQWEEHVKNVIKKEMINYEDFIHWMYEERNKAETELEIIKLVLVPIYIALIAPFCGNMSLNEEVITFAGIVIIIEIIAMLVLIAAKKKMNFYNDITELIKKENPNII